MVPFRQFLFGRLYLPVKVCDDIKKFLLVLLAVTAVIELIAYFNDMSLVVSTSFFSFTFVMMPIFLFMGYSLKKLYVDIKEKNPREKSKKFILSSLAVRFMVLMLMYMYIAIVVLSTLLFLFS